MIRSSVTAALAAAFLLIAWAATPAAAAGSEPILGGAELPLAVAHLALAAQEQPPPEEPEPRPQPFPAPPEQPPAERPPDQPPPDVEPDVDVDIELPDAEAPEVEPPEIEVPELEVETETESDGAWYLDPFWIIVALVFVVVILILIFSGRRRP